MNTKLPDYQKKEVPINEVVIPKSNLHKLANQLKLIGKWIENLLTIKCELKIWHGQDRAGCDIWKIYDPRTNRTFPLASEEEVREWIEKSFYRPHQESDRTPTSFDLYQRRLFF